MARKRTPREKPPEGVVDLDVARAERLVDEVKTLAGKLAEGVHEIVSLTLEAYRRWERENPDHATVPHERLEMIRLGFVGPGGFDRCHEEDRVPRHSYPMDDPIHDDDLAASQVLMCPLMESRRCEPIWKAMQTPPCHLLLLDVFKALGQGGEDWKVGEVLDDFGKLSPDKYRKSFVRADRLIRKAEKDREGDEW